jgi:hypothetical protein
MVEHAPFRTTEDGAARPPGAGPRDEVAGPSAAPPGYRLRLSEQDGGRWHVRTRNTLHIIDLDQRTHQRIPGQGSGTFYYDEQTHLIDRMTFPCVGERMVMYYIDPSYPDSVERWHATSRVVSIQCAEDEDVSGQVNGQVSDVNAGTGEEGVRCEVRVSAPAMQPERVSPCPPARACRSVSPRPTRA